MATDAFIDDPEDADTLASDGGIVTIRPVRPGDRAALAALYAGASRRNLWLRFFIVPGRATLTAELDSLCRPETGDRLSVVALDGPALIGVASCARLDPGSRMAEIALFVADDQHGRGIGTLLLEFLAARARRAGITEFVGSTLRANTGAQRLIQDFHAHARTKAGAGLVRLDVDLTDQPAFDEAVDARERVAERASLRSLLAPESVVVVGAGRHHGGVGHEVLCALRDYGFPGRLYAVNPHGMPVCGIHAHRHLADLPEAPDLAVIAVAADLVPGILDAAGRRGVRSAVVLSKGFGAARAVNRRRRAEVLKIAREHGMRLLGPATVGLISTDPRIRLNACMSPVRPPVGGLAMASQSGAVGIAMLAAATESGCGVSTFVALGEKLDVSSNDLIAYWYDDPRTRAVALHLESFGNPRKFARTVRALSLRKPVLALESGRSRAGRAGSRETVEALFTQAGVIRTTGMEEVLDTARMLIDQPLPAGRRMAIVGNGGGLNVLAADSAEALGFTVSPLTRATRRELPRGRDNPVDLGMDAGAAAIASAAEIVANSGEADILLLIIVATRANVPAGIVKALGDVVDDHPDLTIAAVVTGSVDDLHLFGGRGAPVFTAPDRAIRALAYAHQYAAWRRQPLGRRPHLAGIDRRCAQAGIDQALAAGDDVLPRDAVHGILNAYGISVAPTTSAAPALTMTAGIRHDPLFGSVVRLALRGTPAGLLDGHSLRLVPLTDLDARRMWSDLRAARLLTGRRDGPPVDTAALEELLLRLSLLAENHPEIAEVELTPAPTGPGGITVTGASLRLTRAAADSDPSVRRLSAAARG
ncbi:GNAT family N-acetyltransferase [Actinoplanes sp. NPDC023714]|uniref:bifunctional acetate--CoA ligase family protein/GNAT family N-acetyltransferase n=1 Tax=Actinoplanes sp. NPDC023714 TaxID=3154322 RepID=UPI0033F9E75E